MSSAILYPMSQIVESTVKKTKNQINNSSMCGFKKPAHHRTRPENEVPLSSASRARTQLARVTHAVTAITALKRAETVSMLQYRLQNWRVESHIFLILERI